MVGEIVADGMVSLELGDNARLTQEQGRGPVPKPHLIEIACLGLPLV